MADKKHVSFATGFTPVVPGLRTTVSSKVRSSRIAEACFHRVKLGGGKEANLGFRLALNSAGWLMPELPDGTDGLPV